MLTITVPKSEFYDETNEVFRYTKEQTLQLEHSLVSISKWESKWHKAFLGKQQKTDEELADYVRCMTITQNVDPLTYSALTNNNYKEIQDYIDAPMTATRMYEDKRNSSGGDVPTSELIYYWMISFNIPFECQKWHLNKLLTLIKVCNLKNNPKKRSTNDIIKSNKALNKARRQNGRLRG